MTPAEAWAGLGRRDDAWAGLNLAKTQEGYQKHNNKLNTVSKLTGPGTCVAALYVGLCLLSVRLFLSHEVKWGLAGVGRPEALDSTMLPASLLFNRFNSRRAGSIVESRGIAHVVGQVFR